MSSRGLPEPSSPKAASHGEVRGRDVLRVRAAGPLQGSVQVPPDLDVAARAILFAALSEERSELYGLPSEPFALPILAALSSLGVPIEHASDRIAVLGVGLAGLQMPRGALDCERSWTSLALCAGLLAGQRFGTRITVHDSLARRSAASLVGPLRARGAHIAGAPGAPARDDGNEDAAQCPPLAVAPLLASEQLLGLRCDLPAPDEHAKTAVLVSALYSPQATTLYEPLVSPDHTERLLVALGLPLRRVGAALHFNPHGWDRHIPAQPHATSVGCASCAAYLTTAALLVPASRIALAGACTNPSRTGFFDAIRLWGADVQVLPRGEAAGREPVADLIAATGRTLRGGVLGGELLVRARAELPALALLALRAQRDVEFFDLEAAGRAMDPQARALETLLGAFGIPTLRREGALVVRAGVSSTAARVDVHDDAELAMAAVVLALTADGETVIERGASALSLTHPGFLRALTALGAEVDIA